MADENENTQPEDTEVSAEVTDDEVSPETSTEPGDVDAAADEPTEGTETVEDTTDSQPTGVQKRINELTAKRRQAERDAEYWRERALKSAEPETKPQPKAPKPAPKIDDFDSYEEYIPVAIQHGINQGLAQVKESLKHETLEEQRVRKIQEFHERGKQQHGDFVDKLSRIPVTESMGEAMMASEKGPEMAYHLAENPELATKLAKLSPVEAAMEIGKLEVMLSTKKPSPPSNPKPPLKTVDGRKATTPSIYDENLSVDDYAKARGY